jgi:hypothetical protein
MAHSFYRLKAAEVARRAELAPTEGERLRLSAEAQSWLEIAKAEERFAARERRAAEGRT